jgi:hypothetical protein
LRRRCRRDAAERIDVDYALPAVVDTVGASAGAPSAVVDAPDNIACEIRTAIPRQRRSRAAHVVALDLVNQRVACPIEPARRWRCSTRPPAG